MPGVEGLRRYAEGDSDMYLYTRYGNPTVAAAEEKIAALEGAEAAVATSSGMAAELVAVLATCKAGDEIVSMLDVYGGTVKLFEQVLPRCGIKVRFVPYHDIKNAERYFSRKTRMLFLEIADQSDAALCRSGGAVRAGAQAQSLRSGRQHLRHAGAAKAAGAGRRHRDPFGDEVSGRAQRYHRGRAGGIEEMDGCGAAGDDSDRRMPRSGLRVSAAARVEDAGCARGARLPQRDADCRDAAKLIPKSRACIIPGWKITRPTMWRAGR